MTVSIISTLLFGAPTVSRSGRIIRFDIGDQDAPSPSDIRRQIIEYLQESSEPEKVGDIAAYLGMPRASLIPHLKFLTLAEVIQSVSRTQYRLIKYLETA